MRGWQRLYLIIANEQVYFFTDATVNIDPTAEDLADIAILAADFSAQMDVHPRVALLSFSNFGSTRHPHSEKMRQAVDLVRARRPDLIVDGEVQADIAVTSELMRSRYPFSALHGCDSAGFP